MSFTSKSIVKLALVTCAMFVASCANDFETDVNIDPLGNAISFTPSVGISTRATETTIDNLGDFAVIGRGMLHDGNLYDNLIIGSSNGGEIAERVVNDGNNSNTWKLDRSVYWPSELENMLFFAYTTLKATDTYTDKNVLGTNTDNSKPAFGFDASKQPYINEYKPLKANLTATSDNGVWADGETQKDLLVAFTEQARATNASNVVLKFEHILTQVSIKAKQADKLDSDNRIVKIKGAWIYNAAQGGNLTSSFTKSGDDNKIITVSKSWSAASNKTAFGSFYKNIVVLDGNDKDLLAGHSLMLVPEDLTKWNRKDGNENNHGAYILLLCRVELEHKGDTHEGNADLGEIAVENGKHYHQLFPVNTNNFDGAEYGFVCVPLSSDWNTKGMGKRYTYNLNICGNGTGAGKYPPVLSNEEINNLVPQGTKVAVVGNKEELDLKVTTFRPDNKHVGDDVLDEPIQFSVTVNDWQDMPTDWTGGNLGL